MRCAVLNTKVTAEHLLQHPASFAIATLLTQSGSHITVAAEVLEVLAVLAIVKLKLLIRSEPLALLAR